PDDREELERLVERSPGALLVAERGGEIVGALIAAFDGHRGHMHRLAVAEPERGAGLGRRLIEAGHELLRELGARRVDAIVGVEEEAASALWQRAGYETDPPELVRWARNL
ncbi:MAG: GNAT family N-acetyltransferase, partial [Actinomycetota bacterium]|nr:GNAT family N-acetyltransferase [Actinomycetota bacterium]